MELLSTFFTHYGAMRFFKYCQSAQIPARMQPVPRELSASCGVCVRFQDQQPPLITEHEDMEHCYAVRKEREEESYTQLSV